MIIAFIVSKFFMDPVYEARTVVAPANINALNGSSLTYVVDAENSLQWQMSEDIKSMLKNSQVNINNFNTLLLSDHVLAKCRQSLSLDQSIVQIRNCVEIKLNKDTNTTEIIVSGSDPQENSDLANELVNQTISYARELNQEYMTNMIATLESQLAQAENKLIEAKNEPRTTAVDDLRREGEIARLEQIINMLSGKLVEIQLLQSSISDQQDIIVLSPATPPTDPVSPRIMSNTAIAAVLGFMLIVFAVFVIEYMRSAPEKDKSAA